ncbi:MAG TPA: hypothetical protein VHV75_01365 [Solirubrobacteraceae bacterium]|jgi:hypothetical protein|nr:hypothetical protein [Solirubrobacteraceae bacterium]
MTATLLITATVTPNPDVPLLRVRDPDLRRAEYLDALRFYLSLPPSVLDRLVFAENSQADLDVFRHLAAECGAADRFEAIAVAAAPSDLGRGVGEARIIDEAMRRSESLRAQDGTVWKVTGRYTVRNIAKLILTAPEASLYVNLRRRPQRWCDTYAYAFTRAGYVRYLSDAEQLLIGKSQRGAIPGEIVMAGRVEELLSAGEPIVPRFKHEPRVDGVRAHDLRSYAGAAQRSKYLARVVARRLAPGLWM